MAYTCNTATEAFQRTPEGHEQLLWSPPSDPGGTAAIAAARNADLTIFVAGLTSQVEGEAPLAFTSRHGVLAVTMPCRVPSAEQPISIDDLKNKAPAEVFDEIARKIAEALRITLSPQEQEAIAAKPTENLQAYDLYLRGRSYARRLRFTREGRWFTFLTVGVGFGAINTGNNQFAVLNDVVDRDLVALLALPELDALPLVGVEADAHLNIEVLRRPAREFAGAGGLG